MKQQISQPGRRRSGRKPSFWQSHRTLCTSFVALASASCVAAAGFAVYEHRLAAERIGVATAAPAAPASPAAADSAGTKATKATADATSASRGRKIMHDDVITAATTPTPSAARAAATDVVATADTMPDRGVNTADASSSTASSAGNSMPVNDFTAGLGNGPGWCWQWRQRRCSAAGC
jgi:negative regulator of sigma E activity